VGNEILLLFYILRFKIAKTGSHVEKPFALLLSTAFGIPVVSPDLGR
jgi:hypothetical protein